MLQLRVLYCPGNQLFVGEGVGDEIAVDLPTAEVLDGVDGFVGEEGGDPFEDLGFGDEVAGVHDTEVAHWGCRLEGGFVIIIYSIFHN